MNKASIDIGSNSTLLLVAQITEDKISKTLESISTITALGRDLDKTGEFHPESMRATKKALLEYIEICNKYGVDATEIIVTATEASRVAKNAKKFFEEITKITGLSFNIINGLAEAFYSTQGILLDVDPALEDILIMDIGGASTELIGVKTQDSKIYESFSMPCGSVRLLNWIESSNRSKLDECLAPYLDKINSLKRGDIYCVAGTMTSVGNMILGRKEFIESDVHASQFCLSDLKNLYENVKSMSTDCLLKKYPFLGKRVSTILPGIELSLKILTLLEVERITLSTYGLRYGTLLSDKIPSKFLV